ncbi:MAG: glucose 1-dehydrogenase [Gemmatimonadota bacterium]|nr:glucose 1-dehydrogenase [Gemmatimonadota bacterium]
MKAIAVRPGIANSIHLADIPAPSVADVPDGRGVLARILQVGVDATDREINAAEYGTAPDGSNILVLGHESFGLVEAVGPNVTELVPGDYVVFMVRRPGTSVYDRIGYQDMTTDDVYYERGISRRHGYLTERVVDSADYAIKIPQALRHVAVLLEPTSVAEKAIRQAYLIQNRLGVWRPRKAVVLGAGPLGLLATMALRTRGLDVVTYALAPKPNRNAELAEALGATYVSAEDRPLKDVAASLGNVDLMIEATGFSPLVFEAMERLGTNGVLVLTGIAGGNREADHVHADHILQRFVLGNKVVVGSVNAARADFERGVADFAIAEATWPGWLSQLLTHPVAGLDRYADMIRLLTDAKDAIKIYVNVAADAAARTRAA